MYASTWVSMVLDTLADRVAERLDRPAQAVQAAQAEPPEAASALVAETETLLALLDGVPMQPRDLVQVGKVRRALAALRGAL